MPAEVEQIFRETGAILEGHFLLSSGLHSPVYWEKFRLLQYPHYTEQLCRIIVEHFREKGIQLVAGPALGGVILAYEVARQLALSLPNGPVVRAIFADKGDGGRVFRGGQPIRKGERILIVDDILTTGGSIQEVLAEVKRQGGEVVGVGVLVNRAPEEIDLGVPLFSCHRTIVPTYLPKDCPLCIAGVPLTKPGGKGKGFI